LPEDRLNSKKRIKGEKTVNSLIGGGLVLTAALALVKLIGFLYKLPQTAILGGSGMGIYNQAYVVYGTFYSITVTGFPVAISKIVAGYLSEGRYRDIKRTVRVANLFFMAVGIASSVILIAFSGFYSEKVYQNPNMYYCLIAVAPSIVFSCLMTTQRGFTQGMKNMYPTAVSQVIEVIVKSIVGLLGAYLVKNALTVEYESLGSVLGISYKLANDAEMAISSLAAAGSIFGVTASTFVGWIYLVIRGAVRGDNILKADLDDSPAANTNRYLLRQILAVGIPIAVGSVTVALTQQIDSIMIQRRLIDVLESNPVALFNSHGGWLEKAGKTLQTKPENTAVFLYGCYTFGFSFFSLVPSITGSFGMSALPHITGSWAIRDRDETKRCIDSTLKIIAVFAAPLGFGLTALGTPILHMVFSRYTPEEVAIGGPLLSMLGIASIFLALNGPVNSMLQGIGRLDIPVKLLFVGGLVKVAANYILVGIPSLNIKIAPLGNILCYGLISTLSIFLLQKNTNLKIDIKGSLIKPLAAGAVCGLAAKVSYEVMFLLLFDVIRQKLITLISIAVAGAVYLILLFVMKIMTKNEIKSLPRGEKIASLLEKWKLLG